MFSFPQTSPPTACMHLFCLPQVLAAPIKRRCVANVKLDLKDTEQDAVDIHAASNVEEGRTDVNMVTKFPVK